MKRDESIVCSFLNTPVKEQSYSSKWDNSSRSFYSSGKHRNRIFDRTSSNSTSKKNITASQLFCKGTQQHIQIKQLISDDFCGCQVTLNPCLRIAKKYFNDVSLLQLKKCYESHQKPKPYFSNLEKKTFLQMLPVEYPQIYHTHLKNLLEHFQPTYFSHKNFLLMAWIHFHCKFQHITFFFYCDLKESLKHKSYFYEQLQLKLITENKSYKQQIRILENMNFSIKSFLQDFYQSAGANFIPYTQYAKFLEIVKKKGQRSLVDLILLFFIKKKEQFYEILKYYSLKRLADLRNYSRYLNWDLFFQQIK